MSEYSIYKDIAERTGGDIYVGVVGPVRSGKSTFIKKFMESVVLTNIGEGYSRVSRALRAKTAPAPLQTFWQPMFSRM